MKCDLNNWLRKSLNCLYKFVRLDNYYREYVYSLGKINDEFLKAVKIFADTVLNLQYPGRSYLRLLCKLQEITSVTTCDENRFAPAQMCTLHHEPMDKELFLITGSLISFSVFRRKKFRATILSSPIRSILFLPSLTKLEKYPSSHDHLLISAIVSWR